MTVSADRRSLDPHIWRFCAGSASKIPADGSLVYYFPHGHSEQSAAPLSPSSLPITKPYSLCRVLSVSLLANPDSDEAFAKIHLRPVSDASDPDIDEVIDASDSGDVDEVVSFAKFLTPSDANNGGGFSVPRFCADSIFPKLDFKADPPVQTLSVKDVQGNTWDFRHIYRGTPRRHLLTTGWSRFVNSKKLIASDSITWDEPEVLQNVRMVNPWQVKIVSASPHPQSPFPDMKKLRVSTCLDLSSEGQGSFAPSFLNYNTFPVGMQGARHDTVSSLSNFIPTNNHQFFAENPCGIDMFQELNASHSGGYLITKPGNHPSEQFKPLWTFCLQPNKEI